MNLNRDRLTDVENKLMVIKGEKRWERHKLGVWDSQIQTATHKIDKQKGLTIEYKKQGPML